MQETTHKLQNNPKVKRLSPTKTKKTNNKNTKNRNPSTKTNVKTKTTIHTIKTPTHKKTTAIPQEKILYKRIK